MLYGSLNSTTEESILEDKDGRILVWIQNCRTYLLYYFTVCIKWFCLKWNTNTINMPGWQLSVSDFLQTTSPAMVICPCLVSTKHLQTSTDTLVSVDRVTSTVTRTVLCSARRGTVISKIHFVIYTFIRICIVLLHLVSI